MSTISVPLNSKLELSLDYLVKSGVGSNRAAVMRRALERLSEEEAIQAVLRAEQEISQGKGLRGDLKTLMKKLK
jgi:Arc/MetJ-type ribon-helix-helix transcriptional regulator